MEAEEAGRHAYDVYNRLTKETLPGSKTNTYGYENAGNLLSFADAGGTVQYAYNAANLLTTVTEPNLKQTTFAYDADGMRTQTNYPNGVSMYFSYDASNRLTRVLGKKPASGAVLTDFTYSYANPTTGADTLLRQSVTDKDGNKTNYAYDALNRLIGAEERSSTGSLLNSYAYAYDANSNRTSQTVNGVTTAYTHNSADQLLTAGGVSYSYDANGNETGNSAGRAFTYNPKDQVVSATPAGGTAIPMSYTGTGQFDRVSAGTTTYQNSGLGLTIDGSTYYTRDDDGVLIEMRSSAGQFYYLVDGLGSIAALTDSTGNVVASYAYEPFGKATRFTGTVTNPWRFLGSLGVYLDTAMGLYKTGTRYYDPALGRFLQVDPIEGGSATRYDYANQDPINESDVSGECPACRDKLGGRNIRAQIARIARLNAIRGSGRFKVSIGRRARGKGLQDPSRHTMAGQKIRDVIRRGLEAERDGSYVEYHLPGRRGTYQVGGYWVGSGRNVRFHITHLFIAK